LADVQTEIDASHISFGSYANLDQQMFFATPAPITMPTPIPIVI
jgi:hypothetical protein